MFDGPSRFENGPVGTFSHRKIFNKHSLSIITLLQNQECGNKVTFKRLNLKDNQRNIYSKTEEKWLVEKLDL